MSALMKLSSTLQPVGCACLSRMLVTFYPVILLADLNASASRNMGQRAASMREGQALGGAGSFAVAATVSRRRHDVSETACGLAHNSRSPPHLHRLDALLALRPLWPVEPVPAKAQGGATPW